MKFRPVTLLVTLVPLLLSMPCAAQSQQPVQRSPVAEPTADIDEVVVVRGWRHPVQLRLRMVEAELAVYELFNQLNDDASLGLECSLRNVGGTRLKATECAPRFERLALAQEAADTADVYRAALGALAMTEGNFAPGAQSMQGRNTEQFTNYMPSSSAQSANLAIKVGQNRLQNKMQEIAAEHPEFVEAIKSYIDAKTRYTQAVRRAED